MEARDGRSPAVYGEDVDRDPWERARESVQATLELERRVAVAIRREAETLGISESEFVNRRDTAAGSLRPHQVSAKPPSF